MFAAHVCDVDLFSARSKQNHDTGATFEGVFQGLKLFCRAVQCMDSIAKYSSA